MVLLGACLFSSILNHMSPNAAKDGDNIRKDEGPTGISTQYEQGILADVSFMRFAEPL